MTRKPKRVKPLTEKEWLAFAKLTGIKRYGISLDTNAIRSNYCFAYNEYSDISINYIFARNVLALIDKRKGAKQ